MTFQKKSSFIYKQIAENRRFLLRCIPNSLQKALALALSQHYDELYESEANGDVILEDTLEEILGSFRESYQLLGQLRYVWMALTLAMIVEPTVKYYQPDNHIPEKTITYLTDWLLKTLIQVCNPNQQLYNVFDSIDNTISKDFQNLISTEELSSFQVLSEALDVYTNAIETLKPNQSLPAILNILDDCLEGYAIFPGAYGRRELFDWWLLDVVPSCWYLLPPSSAYSLNASQNTDSSFNFNYLEGMSSLVWLTLIQNTSVDQNQNAGLKNRCIPHDNMLPAISGDVKVSLNINKLH